MHILRAFFIAMLLCTVGGFAQQNSMEQALTELASSYDTCLERVKVRDAEIKDFEIQIENYKKKDENIEPLINDFKELRTTSQSLIDKQELMLQKSYQIEEKFTANMNLCQESVGDLKKALIELNEKYNSAVQDCMKPWYLRMDVWVAAIAGVLAGFAFGSISK